MKASVVRSVWRGLMVILVSFTAVSAARAQMAVSFNYPDTVDYWTVPPGVDSIRVDMAGSSGGSYLATHSGYLYGTGGNGMNIEATLAVTSGQVLRIALGGRAGSGYYKAYNGGGMGGRDAFGYSGGGGGATDIRIGSDTDLAHRVIVAGGGGGATSDVADYTHDYSGGDAGYLAGSTGHSYTSASAGGHGGTRTAGGAGGTHGTDSAGKDGGLGYGGDARAFGTLIAGGGGGGGYYGGGSGSNSGGGGGGSSYADPAIARRVTYTPAGFSGYVTIYYGFEALSVHNDDLLIQQAAIFPNPSAGNALLNLVMGATKDLNIMISDITGRQVWTGSHHAATGSTQLPLPASLHSGMYLVHISGNGRQYEKVLKWMKN